MSTSRPPIPRPDERAIRQRCGFGCVICGLPLYEYDHMDGWATVYAHDPDRITLLCDRHHSEKTKGLLPDELVEEFNARPVNRSSATTPAYPLYYGQGSPAIVLGGNRCVPIDANQDVHALVLDGRSVLGFRNEDGHILLHVDMLNESGSEVLSICDNELRFIPHVFDVKFVGRVLTLRTGHREPLLMIQFNTPDELRVLRAKFWLAGRQIDIYPDRLEDNGICFSDSISRNQVGFILGHPGNFLGKGASVYLG